MLSKKKKEDRKREMVERKKKNWIVKTKNRKSAWKKWNEEEENIKYIKRFQYKAIIGKHNWTKQNRRDKSFKLIYGRLKIMKFFIFSCHEIVLLISIFKFLCVVNQN